MDINQLRSRLKAGEKIEGHLIRKALIAAYGLKWGQVETVGDNELRRLLSLSDAELNAAVVRLEHKPRQPKGAGDLMASIAELVITGIRNGGLDAEIKERVDRLIPPLPTVVIDKATGAEVKLGVSHRLTPVAIKVLAAGVPVNLYSSPGTGKSHFAEAIALASGREFAFDNFVNSMEKWDLVGFKDAQSRYQETNLYRACKAAHEGRKVVYLSDEFDNGSSNANLVLNTAMAQHFLAFASGEVFRWKAGDIWFVLGMNTRGRGPTPQHPGREAQDQAQFSRQFMLEWPIDEALEDAICGINVAKPLPPIDIFEGGIPSKEVWVRDHVRVIREAVAKARIMHEITPRASILGSHLIDSGGLGLRWLVEGLLMQNMEPMQWAKVLEFAKEMGYKSPLPAKSLPKEGK